MKLTQLIRERLRAWFAGADAAADADATATTDTPAAGRSATSATSETGAHGERLAEAFLRKHGLRIVARNWRSPHDRRDEIDLVCTEGEALVFVEVKTRSAGALVPGYYTVDARKKKVLRRAATAYLRTLHPPPPTFRLDVVEISTRAGDAPEIRHFENVPLFSKHFRP